jgi:hypothetical protein
MARRRRRKCRLLLAQARDEEEAAVGEQERGHEHLIFATNLRVQAICEHLGGELGTPPEKLREELLAG